MEPSLNEPPPIIGGKEMKFQSVIIRGIIDYERDKKSEYFMPKIKEKEAESER